MLTPRASYSLFFTLLLTTTLPVSSAGNTLYVSPGGSDGNSCSPNLPCREIRRALELVVAGDTILVADGSYKGFDVRDLRGDAGKPITIKAQGTNAVIQKTTDRPDNRDTVFITFSSYIVVDGLRSFNANRAALRVDQSPKVTIRNCVFGNNAKWGIFTDFSDDLLIKNNETYGSIAEHGIYVSNSGDRPIVRGNRSHDNRAAGIHMNADVNSGGDGIIIGALIENNVIYNNGTGGGAGINMDGVQDSVVRNNVIYNNHATGIALYQIDGAEGPKGNKVYHNTIHQASDGRWALLIWRAWGNNTLRNNVLYHPNPARGGINFLSNADVVSTDSDYNVLDRITPDDAGTVYTLAQWKLQAHETHSLSATPTSLFVNAAGGDFHLAASSPAIDRGRTLPEVTRDRDGNPRPLGTASDIGAYEAGGKPSPSLSVTPASLPFGSVNVGSSKNLTVTVKNAGTGTLTGSASTSAPFAVVGAASYSLAANQSAVLTVRFSPTAAGAASRNLSFTGGGGGSVSLSGTGVSTTPVLTVTPSSLPFGSVNVGSSKNLTVTVKNVGGGTLTGSASTSAPFTVVAPASHSLAANQTVVLTVRFSPTAAGASTRTLSLTGGGGGSVSLSGTGVSTTPVLTVTPSSLAFASVNVGSSKNLTVTVKNVGGGTLIGSASTFAPFAGVGAASYSLAPNQTAVLTVRFSPTTAGAASRTLSLTGGGGGSVSLSGTGVSTKPAPEYWAENRPPAGGPHSLPKPLFPASNWWNQDISRAPVDPKSSMYTAALGAVKLMYDWGNNYGLPYTTVSGNYPKVRFAGGSYWSESDNVDYPIPIPALTEPGWTEELGARLTDMIKSGKDRHLLIVDVDNQRLYEIYQPFYNAGKTPVRWGSSGTGPLVHPGQYYCASAATWDLRSNNTRPEGWTSSDAAGLQVLPGLVQYDEVTGTEPIRHAHRLTLNFAANTPPYYVWPATHYAGNWSKVNPPLGARFRLKASKDISRFGPHAQKLLQSMKTYGVIFADNGTNGHITGTNDPRWGNYDSPIRTEFAVALTSLTFADFEVISLGWK